MCEKTDLPPDFRRRQGDLPNVTVNGTCTGIANMSINTTDADGLTINMGGVTSHKGDFSGTVFGVEPLGQNQY